MGGASGAFSQIGRATVGTRLFFRWNVVQKTPVIVSFGAPVYPARIEFDHGCIRLAAIRGVKRVAGESGRCKRSTQSAEGKRW